MSKTSASVSAGVPNTEKQMKARGRRPSAFIVSRCLEPLMKHEARVFDMTSQSRLKIQCNKACKNNVFPQGAHTIGCVADCYFIVNVLDLPFASPIAIYR